jgi:uncharacterized protein (DUF1778 family)
LNSEISRCGFHQLPSEIDQTRTDFIISAAREKAERIAKERRETIREVAPMVLDAVDSRIFLEALERDFEPNQALMELNKTSHHDIIDRT